MAEEPAISWPNYIFEDNLDGTFSIKHPDSGGEVTLTANGEISVSGASVSNAPSAATDVVRQTDLSYTTDTRTNVSNSGTQVVSNASDINVTGNLSASADSDGSATLSTGNHSGESLAPDTVSLTAQNLANATSGSQSEYAHHDGSDANATAIGLYRGDGNGGWTKVGGTATL